MCVCCSFPYHTPCSSLQNKLCILGLVVYSNWCGMTTLLLICSQVQLNAHHLLLFGQKSSMGFKFTSWLNAMETDLKLDIHSHLQLGRAGLVQAVESYRLWPEGPGFKSWSPRIAQASVRLATNTLPQTRTERELSALGTPLLVGIVMQTTNLHRK